LAYKILLADDHAVVRQGLKTLLEQDESYRVVAETDTGESAFLLWQEHHPDLAILDLDMPGIGGLKTLQRIVTRFAGAKVLIFSMHDDNIYAARAIQAGARGYVVKTDAPETLLEAVRQILRGGRFIGHELAQHMAVERLTGTQNPIDSLSPKEFEVFRRIAEGESLTQISEQLNIGYKTAANIQTQVRQKLGVATTGQLVHLAMRFGITQSRD
jgi:two-component system, NarL family, invasion response regulator UvrY